MPTKWFAVSDKLSSYPDFISLSESAMDNLCLTGCWVEWKILRSFQVAYTTTLGSFNDVCYRLACNTRAVAESAIVRGDYSVLVLALKFFNTYLRHTFKNRDTRTAYNVLHQYRLLAEFLLIHKDNDELGRVEQQKHLLQTMWYFRYYSVVAIEYKMAFVAEIISHDMQCLIQLAYRHENEPPHDKMFQLFLTLDSAAIGDNDENALAGILKSYVKIAVFYLSLVDGESTANAKKIFRKIRSAPKSILENIFVDLKRAASSEYWESNDRGVNIDFLDSDQRHMLNDFFSWFKGLDIDTRVNDQQQVARLTGRRQSKLLVPQNIPSQHGDLTIEELDESVVEGNAGARLESVSE
jgi:hypothetical protein